MQQINMHEIKVTVLMPAYNAEKYISAAIQSVLDQSFTDFEFLIVNDGSTDNTENIIRSFEDDRIILMSQKNGGVSNALNAGLQKARGKYIARFDSDDICYTERLAEQVVFMEANSEYILIGSDVDYITDEGEFIYHHHCLAYTNEELSGKIYFYCPFIHSAVMYKKQEVLQAGGYNTLAHTFEDYFLWIQMVSKGKVANLPKSLIKVRLNPGSVTMDEKWRGSRFRKLKRTIIKRGSVMVTEAETLLTIIKQQDIQQMKQGAYYALCAKKFLTDNYQPVKARKYAVNAIRAYPFRWDTYVLLLASYLPEKCIQWLHRQSPNRL
jgi:glycosyltransferase involved in cell wall biosynthesis